MMKKKENEDEEIEATPEMLERFQKGDIMSEKIVGIEVSIGGDTTGLNSALSKTNKEKKIIQKVYLTQVVQ